MSWVLKYNIYIFSLCRQFKCRIIWYGIKNNNYVCGFTINDNVFAELLFYKIQSIDNIKFVPDCRLLRKLLRIKNDINFFPQLQQLLNNKIPIVTAIKMCAKSNNNPHTRYILLRLANQVTAGINLYTALEEFNYCFDSIIIGLIMVGELSITPSVVFNVPLISKVFVRDNNSCLMFAIFSSLTKQYKAATTSLLCIFFSNALLKQL